MMSKSRVLVFVVTFMSFIDYSYLNRIVELPNIDDQNYEDYIKNINSKRTVSGKILSDDEFIKVKNHYENVMKAECEKPDNVRLIEEIKKFAIFNEKRMLRILLDYNYTISIQDYIETRKKHYQDKILKRDEATYLPEVETMHDDNVLFPLEKQRDEELNFLESFDYKGRLRSIYLSTEYGSNQHKILEQKNSIDSIWLYHILTLDPMFGEKYNSYAFRVISMKKMPLLKDDIPKYYGNGKFYIFNEFDVWPELDAVFIMYYLFNCHLQPNIAFDMSHEATNITENVFLLPSTSL